MEFINKEGLMDLDLHGIQFTWTNKRIGNEFIQARLDRALISPDWTKDFVCKLEASQKVSADHFRLILTIVKAYSKKNYPFRFDKMWMQHPHFKSKLEEWWNIEVEGIALYKVATKLRNVKKESRIWNKRCFENIFEIKPKIKEELKIVQDRIQKEGYTPDLVREENGKLAKYHDIVTKEEIYWRQ